MFAYHVEKPIIQGYHVEFPNFIINYQIFRKFITNLIDQMINVSSSSYPEHPAHRKLWSGSMEGRKTAAHTHRGECSQRVSRLEKGKWLMFEFINYKETL